MGDMQNRFFAENQCLAVRSDGPALFYRTVDFLIQLCGVGGHAASGVHVKNVTACLWPSSLKTMLSAAAFWKMSLDYENGAYHITLPYNFADIHHDQP
jgi:hypothetical protein